NYQRKTLNDDESIYYVKVTFEGLERDIYSIDVSGSGYRETKVDNIEIMDYSKRVKLGNSLSQTGYNTAFLAGDINGDSIIDMEDYQLVFDKIGIKNTKTDLKKYDLNRDGKIDVADLSVVYENIGKNQEEAKVENTDKIIDINEIKLETNAELNGSTLNDILLNNNSVVKLGMKDGENPSEENPLTIFLDLSSSKRRSKEDGIEMEQIVIKSPENESDDGAGPSEGFIIYTDENGNEHRVEFSDTNEEIMTISSNNDIIIDLGKQVAVKEISINVTSNRGNKNISEIAKIEFLNNVYKEIPKPDMNIPVIKTLETSTEMHDERITISWEPEPNVTSYEVKYEKLNDNGQVIKTKKLQTNKTHLNILDKDISPYDFYRVSIQSLNGDWSSGYEEKTDDHTGYDGKPDNVDSDFNPIQS
ncbi:MAG: dockerin type I domain-containing protein, partial [Clostridium sp.]|nr:dockerin type I domain-containing protein [Clostridium sp.]